MATEKDDEAIQMNFIARALDKYFNPKKEGAVKLMLLTLKAGEDTDVFKYVSNTDLLTAIKMTKAFLLAAEDLIKEEKGNAPIQ